MADLTSAAPLRLLGEAYTEKFTLDSSAAQTIFKGQPMIVDQSEDTVNVRGFVDATVVAATDVFVGIAAENSAIAAAATENIEVECYVEPSIVGFKSAVFTAGADYGKPVRMSDSGTLSSTVGDNPEIGKLFLVKDGYAFVKLVSPYICSGA